MGIFKVFSAAALGLACAFAQAQTEVALYTYNDRTPFVVDKAKGEGLEYRLCDWLSKESKGQYHFTLKVTTAAEVRTLLESDQLKGAVIGVNQAWFSAAIQKKALWTPAILFDKNTVVSMSSKKVHYAGPESLLGLRAALVKNWFYPELGEAYTSGKSARVDFASEPLALKGLAEGKAEVAVVSEWTYLYEQLRGDLQGDFFVADKPAFAFTRTILVPASNKPLHEHLSRILKDVKANPGWQEATSL